MELNQKQKSLIDQFLKRAFTILSVSIFSLFFSHSTVLAFLPYFNFYYILTLPLKLFSHTLDKNCTFLLCNGILAFLANYSGSSSSSSSTSSSSSSSDKYNLNDLKSYEDDSQPKMTIMETTQHHHQLSIPLLEQEAELENIRTQPKKNSMQHENRYKESEALEAEDENSTNETEALEAEDRNSTEENEALEAKDENSTEENIKEQQEVEKERAVLEEDNDKAEAGSSFFIEEVGDEVEEVEEEEEEGGENEKLSNEELNKKCDDFIRKMKEEIRMEARQQLTMI